MVNIPSVLALFSNAIDYAGTFPPAQLPTNEALKTYSTYRGTGTNSWLMGRMVLRLAEIAELSWTDLFEYGRDGRAWIFTALARGSESELVQDLEQVNQLNITRLTLGNRLQISAIETRAFETLQNFNGFSAAWTKFQHAYAKLITGPVRPTLYVEMPSNFSDLPQIAALLSSSAIPCGLKVRTGGAVIPTSEQLAQVIQACATNDIPFKATQGLHSAMTRGKDFGFVNLLMAVALAHAKKLTKDKIQNVLSATNPTDFKISSHSIEWNGLRVSLDDIINCKQKLQPCFGSCSIKDPDDDLELFMKGQHP